MDRCWSIFTPKLRTSSTAGMTLSPIVMGHTPYCIKWCFDMKMSISILSSFNFSHHWAIHSLISLTHASMRAIALSLCLQGWLGRRWHTIEYRQHIYGSHAFLLFSEVGVVSNTNITGPSTDPCGTPHWRGTRFDFAELIFTCCVRPLR